MVFGSQGRDLVFEFWTVMGRGFFFLSLRLSWGCMMYLYQEPCGESHRCCFSVGTDASFTPRLEASVKPVVK